MDTSEPRGGFPCGGRPLIGTALAPAGCAVNFMPTCAVTMTMTVAVTRYAFTLRCSSKRIWGYLLSLYSVSTANKRIKQEGKRRGGCQGLEKNVVRPGTEYRKIPRNPERL